jgi:hypothetical protein
VVVLSETDRAVLEERARAYSAPFSAVVRAKIVLPRGAGHDEHGDRGSTGSGSVVTTATRARCGARSTPDAGRARRRLGRLTLGAGFVPSFSAAATHLRRVGGSTFLLIIEELAPLGAVAKWRTQLQA